MIRHPLLAPPSQSRISLRSLRQPTDTPYLFLFLSPLHTGIRGERGIIRAPLPTAMAAVKRGTRPPWVGLAAGVWVNLASGNSQNFPLYSPFLKAVLGYTQQQLTMLGVAADIGENFGLLAGFLSNHLPPWVVVLIGCIFCFVGYGVIWLAVTETVRLPYWVLWISLCIATNSSPWFGTGVLVTNMRNFPLSRGTVAGVLKGYVGLSAAVFTEVYTGVLHSSPRNLLFFLSLGLPAICLVLMYFVRPCTPASGEDLSEPGHFMFTQIASVVLALYLLAVTIFGSSVSLNDTISRALFSVMVLLLLAPLAIPLKMTFCRSVHKSSVISSSGSPEILLSGASDKSEPLLPTAATTSLESFQDSDEISEVDILLAEGVGAVKKKRRPRRGEDFEFHEAFFKADFWLLFLVFFVGVGSGVTVLNNLAQIGIAAGVNDATFLLCLFSFCNFIGRLGGGTISEYFVRSRNLPRPIWMTFTQVIMVVAYLLFAVGLNDTLYPSTALLGICYGVQFSVMVPTASEIFGLKNFGMIYNFMSLGNPLGAFLFSGLLAGYIYDKEEARQHGHLLSSSNSCMGPNCFRVTFMVLAGICSIGTLLSIILTVRVKPVYQMLYSGGSFRQPQSSLN